MGSNIPMSMLDEFKTFAVKGNAMDMAVGVIIGTAFNKIVTSLVNDIVMPPLGYVIGGGPFRDLKYQMVAERVADNGSILPTVTVNDGIFLNTIIEFLIIAWTVFIVVKIMNRVIRKRAEEPSAQA